MKSNQLVSETYKLLHPKWARLPIAREVASEAGLDVSDAVLEAVYKKAAWPDVTGPNGRERFKVALLNEAEGFTVIGRGVRS